MNALFGKLYAIKGKIRKLKYDWYVFTGNRRKANELFLKTLNDIMVFVDAYTPQGRDES